MGSFDGAKLYELIGIYIQSLLIDSIKLITKENIGLYWDDGLILLWNINSQQTDRLRKRIIKKLQSIGLKIEIVTNLQDVDFLGVTFNLINNTYVPFKKPNDNLTYINTSSNHPSNIIKQLTKTVSQRLSRNSSSIEIFNSSKLEYKNALKKSGYTEPSIYIPPRPPSRNLMEGKEKSCGLTHRLMLMFQQTLPKHSYVLSTNILPVHTNLTKFLIETRLKSVTVAPKTWQKW